MEGINLEGGYFQITKGLYQSWYQCYQKWDGLNVV